MYKRPSSIVAAEIPAASADDVETLVVLLVELVWTLSAALPLIGIQVFFITMAAAKAKESKSDSTGPKESDKVGHI